VPTYTYACTGCGERIEAVQKFTDDPLTTCAACGASLRKVFSAVGVVFKGSGFYRTDSRAASGHNGDSSTSESKDSDASGAKSESESSASSSSDKNDSGSGPSAASAKKEPTGKKDSSGKVA
jgi:putative FmdB family regulatory protein